MVYLDNAATTRVCPEAAEAAVHMMTECFGNPSTTYKLGREAKAAVDKARGQIAKALGCQPDEVYFTSCGSEGDNWALISGARYMRRRGKHIISSAVEHDAVRKSLDFLEKEGYEITRLQPDGTGAIPRGGARGAAAGHDPRLAHDGQQRDRRRQRHRRRRPDAESGKQHCPAAHGRRAGVFESAVLGQNTRRGHDHHQRSQDPRAERHRRALHPQRTEAATLYPRRRAGARHARRYGGHAADRRLWYGGRDRQCENGAGHENHGRAARPRHRPADSRGGRSCRHRRRLAAHPQHFSARLPERGADELPRGARDLHIKSSACKRAGGAMYSRRSGCRRT